MIHVVSLLLIFVSSNQVVNTVDMDVSISEAQFESNTANTMDGGAISFEV